MWGVKVRRIAAPAPAAKAARARGLDGSAALDGSVIREEAKVRNTQFVADKTRVGLDASHTPRAGSVIKYTQAELDAR